MSQYFAKGHRDRREARTARRRRAVMFGGDPYEDDVERVSPVVHAPSSIPTIPSTEQVDKPN
jgi:hypothetical protein